MPRKVDHGERRRALATAAAELISERGAHRVKLLDVAKRAGCTTGAIAYFFPNKDALWMEAIRVAFELQMETFEASRGDLMELVRFTLPKSPMEQAIWRMLLSMTDYALWHPSVTEDLRPIYAALEDFFQKAFAQAVAQGQLPASADPDLTMSTLWAWLDGLGMQAIQDPERWPPEKQEAALVHFFGLLGWKEQPKLSQPV